MAEGRWADWQVRQIAENVAEKRPKREWFEHIGVQTFDPQDKGIQSDFKPNEGHGEKK